MSKYHKLIDRTFHNESTIKLTLEKKTISYSPGQIFSIGIKDEIVNREYSSYNSPNDDHLEFLIKLITDGVFSKILKKIDMSSKFLIHGPFGQFNYNETKSKPLFICSGTGIAPFRSFIKSFNISDYKIIHGIREENEMYDRLEYKSDSYIPCISRDNKTNFYKGRVTDFLKEYDLSNFDSFYICGNSAMISDTYNLLKSKNIKSSDILTESFF